MKPRSAGRGKRQGAPKKTVVVLLDSGPPTYTLPGYPSSKETAKKDT